MNPWSLVIIGIGLLLIIIGVQGTQHNLAGAVTGHAPKTSTGTSTGTTTATTRLL